MPSTTTESPLAPNVTVGLLKQLIDRIDVPSERQRRDVIAPFTESSFASFPEATPDDMRAAVARARVAQESWAATSLSHRVAILTRFHDLLIERADIALDLIQLEGGKARVPALEEVYDTVASTQYYFKTGPRLLERKRRAVSFPLMTTAWEYRHPYGVVGSMTPWNFPFTLAVADIVPALLAGNAVVAKPDENTPFSLLYGVSLLEEAGLPEGLIQVVTGAGEVVGGAMIESVDFMLFTGSTEVGRLVAEQSGRRLIGSSMELGGKNAAIVLADADLDKTIPGIARAVFANGGQLCIAMERIYVDARIQDEFTHRFVEHARDLQMTARFDFSSNLSSMITREHLDKVHSHVEDAIDRGATLLTGGKPRPDVGPLFYEPTVFADVDESMLLCRTETFGPVVSIYGFLSEEGAIERANDSEYGLNASVWTRDVSRGVEMASRVKAGTVGVNDGYAATWSAYGAPMGGMKASGVGRRHGADGLLRFTESQNVAVQRIGPAFAPFGGIDYPTYQRILGSVLKLSRKLPLFR